MPLVITILSFVLAMFCSSVLTESVTQMVYPIVEDKVIDAIHLDEIPAEDLAAFTNHITNPEALIGDVKNLLPERTEPMLSYFQDDLEEFLVENYELIKDESKETLETEVYGYLTEDQIKKLEETGVELKVKGLELKDAADTVLSTTKMAMNEEAVLFSVVFPVTYRLTALFVHGFLWCVFSVLFIASLTTIKNVTGLAFKLPVIGWVDKLGGAAIGAAQYGIVLFAIGWFLKMFGFMTLHELGQGSILFSKFF
ncbi:MAG: CvpA family protein [Lachnospiraceae bacterium]|nr:CvpA family protein [Lachnospiraceae bacterium]